jgi:hypothetical protein
MITEVQADSRRQYQRDYYHKNKDRIKGQQKAAKAKDPVHTAALERNRQLRSKYGITSAQYDTMLSAQNGGCAICGSTSPKSRFGKFHVDHCHSTGAVRGLLCSPCNTAIGLLGDKPEVAEAAASYLRKNGQR